MKIPLMPLLVAASVASTVSADTVNFDAAKPGELPPHWTGTKSGAGTPKWGVVADETAPSKPNALRQSGEADYPLALLDGTSLKDGFVEVKFKALSGKEDQAGGIVWRATDASNYYIARANALEGNVRIYHFVNGKRTQFKGANVPVSANTWHTLRVNFEGERFSVIFNGKELFTASDSTFRDAGKVGLWTKADSVTHFDDLSFGEK